MTHDELLALLSSTNRRYAGSQDNSALRAVVELHKPFTEFGDASCEACFNADYSHKDQPYPCPTIQAIKKELTQWDS